MQVKIFRSYNEEQEPVPEGHNRTMAAAATVIIFFKEEDL